MLKKKKPTANACTSTASGGVLKCVLESGHKGWHSSAQRGQKPKPAQHAEWTVTSDGRTQVTTFSRGKRQTDWFEDPPTGATVAVAPHVCANAARDAATGKPAKGAHAKCPKPEKAAAKAHPAAWNCSCTGDRHMMGAEGCKFEANGSVRQAKQTALARSMPTSEIRILGYRRHPAAALFPLMEGEALETFADRVQASGLRDPIVLVDIGGEDWILDGSNRGIACERRGVVPRFDRYTGPVDMGALIAYSLDKNGDGRRHLTVSVRAMIAAEAATLGRGNPGKRETGGAAGLSQAEAGKRLNVGERAVRKAVAVRDKGTAKVKEAVMAGKLEVEAAELVTRLPGAEQDEIADRALAKKGAIKSGYVRAIVKQKEKRAIVRKINEQDVGPMPVGEFGVIYGDYPWLYDNSDQHEGSRGHITYPGMPMDEILAHAREAAKRAAKNCIVALWVTNAYVHEIGRVVEAYGAELRTMLTWPKKRAGVGSWPRGQTEHLVIASIGEPTHTLNEISTLLPVYELREHSRKPDEVAELLRKHCAGPFLEMFGRDARDGWTVWGAEPNKFAEAA